MSEAIEKMIGFKIDYSLILDGIWDVWEHLPHVVQLHRVVQTPAYHTLTQVAVA